MRNIAASARVPEDRPHCAGDAGATAVRGKARLAAALSWIKLQEGTTVNSPSPDRQEIDTVASLGPRCLAGLRALQQIQRLYDDDMWDIDHPAHSKVRHIHVHLSHATGRLAALIEPADHDAFHQRDSAPPDTTAVAKLIADLVMHAAQLANAYDVDLDSALASRYRNNARRFAPESAFADFAAEVRRPQLEANAKTRSYPPYEAERTACFSLARRPDRDFRAP
jgi:hypothetical protein